MSDREFFPVTCWCCGQQVGWKSDYSHPMPSVHCDRCKEAEERSHEQ